MDSRREFILPVLANLSKQFEIPLYLADAIICTESEYLQYAVRYEPHMNLVQLPQMFSKKNHITLGTEKQLQKFSFGLFQVLGVTARSMGFDGALPELFEIEKNIIWGLRYLDKQLHRYRYEDEAIAAYNRGSAFKNATNTFVNQGYVDKVHFFIDRNGLKKS